jgi:undecaprenyl-diphosphatase
MSLLQALILSVIEGITEFLPVSSTGHMVIASALMHPADPAFTKLFTVNIQFGAILSVVVLYFRRFLVSFSFYTKLFVAFLPSAAAGLLLDDYIDAWLGNAVVVALTLLFGGIVLLFVDKWFPEAEKESTAEVTYPRAFRIGLFQCIAMLPGVSRSAATIIGGLSQKLNRRSAAEFSFFLAVPTMFAASAYKLLDNYTLITSENIGLLLIGNITAFVVAMLAIKTFISFLTRHGFRLFGYYRIFLGIAVLALYLLGVDLKIN